MHESRLSAGNLRRHAEDAYSEHWHSAAFDVLFHVVSRETVLQVASSFPNGRCRRTFAVSDLHHPIGQRKILVNLWLAPRACKVLNGGIGLVGAGHDHDVLTHVALQVPTMSNKVPNLLDVDVASLKNTSNVTFAPCEALHQWSDTVIVLAVDVRCKLVRHSPFYGHGRSCPS